ncbi:hypothetical protein RHMOL_Rhmol06G0231400 [Rhododendron molle]|uniref:Uncharacterized protein n=1 Tax=Rhododendron molle TaxID=49168 RepID=A0ACC0NGG9_RHOML|nr:hypothetical protein RHMOL_Rhmol06G0231400 [Rhododendron molle]
MEILSRSFRLERGSPSMRLGRSNRSFLVSDLVSSEISNFTSYERLSESMRITSGERSRTRSRAWASLVSKAFSFRKTGGGVSGRRVAEDAEETPRVAASAEGRKRTRSSWLPDPQRRWPVQGW